MSENKWYVITGGPCAGKTTTLTKLKELGYETVEEPARVVIERGLRNGKSLDVVRSSPDFIANIHLQEFSSFNEAPKDKTVFFDRSFVDSLAYGKLFGAPKSEKHDELAWTKPFKKIFLLDLVGYVQDEARNETPEQAAAIHKALKDTYLEYGFEVIEVPVLPVLERAEFIMQHLKNPIVANPVRS